MRKVTVAATVAVSEGPSITVNESLDIEHCELTQHTLDGGGTEQAVSFGSAAERLLQFLWVSASEPGLEYTVNGGEDGAPSATLSYLLVLIGETVISQLLANPVTSMSFKNPLDHPVHLNIIAGRPANGAGQPANGAGQPANGA